MSDNNRKESRAKVHSGRSDSCHGQTVNMENRNGDIKRERNQINHDQSRPERRHHKGEKSNSDSLENNQQHHYQNHDVNRETSGVINLHPQSKRKRHRGDGGNECFNAHEVSHRSEHCDSEKNYYRTSLNISQRRTLVLEQRSVSLDLEDKRSAGRQSSDQKDVIKRRSVETMVNLHASPSRVSNHSKLSPNQTNQTNNKHSSMCSNSDHRSDDHWREHRTNSESCKSLSTYNRDININRLSQNRNQHNHEGEKGCHSRGSSRGNSRNTSACSSFDSTDGDELIKDSNRLSPYQGSSRNRLSPNPSCNSSRKTSMNSNFDESIDDRNGSVNVSDIDLTKLSPYNERSGKLSASPNRSFISSCGNSRRTSTCTFDYSGSDRNGGERSCYQERSNNKLSLHNDVNRNHVSPSRSAGSGKSTNGVNEEMLIKKILPVGELEEQISFRENSGLNEKAGPIKGGTDRKKSWLCDVDSLADSTQGILQRPNWTTVSRMPSSQSMGTTFGGETEMPMVEE